MDYQRELQRLARLKRSKPQIAPAVEIGEKLFHLLAQYPYQNQDLEIMRALEKEPLRMGIGRSTPIGRNTTARSIALEVFKRRFLKPWAEEWRMKILGRKTPLSLQEFRDFLRKEGRQKEDESFNFFVPIAYQPCDKYDDKDGWYLRTAGGGIWVVTGIFVPQDSLLAKCTKEAMDWIEPASLLPIILGHLLLGLDFSLPILFFEEMAPFLNESEDQVEILPRLSKVVIHFLEPPTWEEMQELYRELRKNSKELFGVSERYSSRDVELFRFLVDKPLPPRNKGRMKFWEEAWKEWNRTHKKSERFASPGTMRITWLRLQKRLIRDFGEEIFEEPEEESHEPPGKS